MNWRFYWDYSGGNVFENMVHQVGFWHQVLGLGIPETVTMAGANYQSPKMEVPDTMAVSMNHREKILFTWNSMFGNAYYGETHDYLLGTKGTVMHDASGQILYFPQGKPTASRAEEGEQPKAGYTDYTLQHMQNFFDSVRSRKEPVCPFELGFRTAITCQMAITSYRQQRRSAGTLKRKTSCDALRTAVLQMPFYSGSLAPAIWRHTPATAFVLGGRLPPSVPFAATNGINHCIAQ